MVERARATGTRLLFATPHVCPGYWLTRRRRDADRAALRGARGGRAGGHRAAPGLRGDAGPRAAALHRRPRAARPARHQRAAGGRPAALAVGRRRPPASTSCAAPCALAWRRSWPIRSGASAGASAPTASWPCGCARPARCCRSTPAASPAATPGPAGAEDARRIIAEGLCDAIGSDAHGARYESWPRLDDVARRDRRGARPRAGRPPVRRLAGRRRARRGAAAA